MARQYRPNDATSYNKEMSAKSIVSCAQSGAILVAPVELLERRAELKGVQLSYLFTQAESCAI